MEKTIKVTNLMKDGKILYEVTSVETNTIINHYTKDELLKIKSDFDNSSLETANLISQIVK